MLSITSVLSLFTLLLLSTGIYYIAKRVKIPYTVLLVLIGIVLVPLVKLPVLNSVFGFIDDMHLTPELLFYIFLPMLIFESGFNMNIRKMLDSIWSISLLSVVGMLISSLLIASLMFLLLPLVGIEVPFIVALIFGSVISATDPVAVLALFKEYGAPKRLTMMFEGESLFNDGTAVALFTVLLGIAASGYSGSETIANGIFVFIQMVGLGILFGLLMAAFFSAALRYAKNNEFVTVTLLIISAHLVFILCELINETPIFGLHIHISPIIATTISSLFLGNYSRHILTPQTDEFIGKFIEHISFMVNSLVFILAGLLFASSNIQLEELWLPILLAVIIVAVVRAVSVMAVILPLNLSKVESHIPFSWAKLMAWGSLRGALAIIVIMLVPEDLMIDGWSLPYSPREFLLALTIGCILATLFIKAPSIGYFLKKYKLDTPEPLEEAHVADLGRYYLLTEKSRFSTHKTRGFVADGEYKEMTQKVKTKLDTSRYERDILLEQHGVKLFEQSLHLTAIDIEKQVLKQLYVNNELSERVYRKIFSKLSLQVEKIEYAQHDDIDPSMYQDRKDVFDRLVSFVQSIFERNKNNDSPIYKLQYYRAQMIMARKAVKTIRSMQTEFSEPVFLEKPYEKVIARYEKYHTQCSEKVDKISAKHSSELAGYLSSLAQRSLNASGIRAIEYLHAKGISSEEFEHDIQRKYSVK